ncbi:MAG: hypothetical protein FJ276_21275, partial [Planctomycetes bacterium]|nr:hypothetical protein [Planctomycetota bacterium]
MNIGKVRLTVPVTLAPMEEHTNHPFRLLMKRFGAGLVCTERIDAAAVVRRDRRAERMLHVKAIYHGLTTTAHAMVTRRDVRVRLSRRERRAGSSAARARRRSSLNDRPLKSTPSPA